MGLLITICVALVVIGGLKRISQISQVVVPFMAVAYVLCCLIMMICNVTEIPHAVVEIVKSAFGMDAVAGGALGAMIVAMQVLQEVSSPTKPVWVLPRSLPQQHVPRNRFVRVWSP